MRNYLLLLVAGAVMTVTSAEAFGGNSVETPLVAKHSVLRNSQNNLKEMPRAVNAGRNFAPERITADGRVDENDVLITDPEGEKRMYIRDTDSWYLNYYWMYHAYDYGYAQEVVFGKDNDVYFKNPFGGWVTNSYLKGTIEGDTIVVNLPQYILEDQGYKYTAKLAKVALDADEYADATLSDDQVLKFLYKDGKIKQVNKDVSLAMYSHSNNWSGYADGKYEMTLLTEEAASAPEAESKDYSMLYDEDGHHVSIATVGNDFYIKGLCSSLPDVWAKGTISGNTVTLKAQYLGIVDNHHAYFVPGELTIDQVQGTYYYTYYVLPELELTYDAENDKYTIPQNYSYVINTNKSFADPLEYYDNAVIVRQADVTESIPATPIITDVWMQDSSLDGTNYIDFTLLKTDVNGELLDVNRLYYNLYFDDEVATLFCDDYIYAKEDMTDIPYNYEDGHDIFVDGTSHTIYLYGEGFDKIGVQAIYRSANGEEYRSEVAYRDVTGISDVTISKAVKSVEFYDIMGRRVTKPSNGIYVKRVTYTDGSVATSKQAIN
jgi:hypothetical protein